MNPSITDLQTRWEEISETIEELAEEKRTIRKKIIELGGALKISRNEQNQERSHEIVALFKEGKTLQEIGDMYGFSRERARQILKRSNLSRKDGGHSVKKKQKHCLVDGCLNGGPYSLGFCKKHYERFRKGGDPLQPTKFDHDDKCSVEGCGRPYGSNGYCNTHYHRWLRTGSPGEAEILPVGKHKIRRYQKEKEERGSN